MRQFVQTQAHTQPEQTLHLFLKHKAPLIVWRGGLWSETFACRCIGTICREEGWEERVILLPLGSMTWGGLLLELSAGDFSDRFCASLTVFERTWLVWWMSRRVFLVFLVVSRPPAKGSQVNSWKHQYLGLTVSPILF